MEHKSKLRKPWAIDAYEKCRECSHDKFMHILDMQEDPYVLLGACQQLVKGAFCSCAEFASPDNLEYIEQLAKRRGLIPEETEDTK